MNVFVLCTGRCGSNTFATACSHITNYTAGHETRSRDIGTERLAFPPRHIEVDNYLSWFLGRLNEVYGDRAMYVHLSRDPEAVAQSFNRRWEWLGSLPAAYRDGLLMGTNAPRIDCCRDMVVTVTANIEHFLRDKTRVLRFRTEDAFEDWPRFWEWIDAEGDYAASLSEWSVRHNADPKGWRVATRDMRHRAQRVYRAVVPR